VLLFAAVVVGGKGIRESDLYSPVALVLPVDLADCKPIVGAYIDTHRSEEEAGYSDTHLKVQDLNYFAFAFDSLKMGESLMVEFRHVPVSNIPTLR
jgi:hypothetical protein